jgi:citrate lyase beta subunit
LPSIFDYTNERLRQPVQTLYGGAHLFRPDTTLKLGALARKAWDQFGPTGKHHERIVAKLNTEPIEDLRIDFEDGYGVRSSDEEDGHAIQAAKNLSDPAAELPAFIGIRIKSFSGNTRARAERTLRLFLDHLTRIPVNFTVTLPKIETPDDLHDLAAMLPEPIAIEAMIESPAILPHLRELPKAAAGRLRGAHFGPYDFTSACGILSVDQSLDHPLCDTARHQMLIAFAGTDVTVADGPTATLPLGIDRAAIHAAWDLHGRNVRRSIQHGFHQSWDLHPAQLPARYAAIFDLFHEAADGTAARLRNFLDKAAQATALGTAFDDAATVLGYLIFFDRAINCGAFTAEEVEHMTGLTRSQVSARVIPDCHTVS